jgi:hypothetical protein
VSPNQRRCSEGLHGCRRSGFWEAYSRPLVTASSTPTSSAPTSTTSTSSSTSNHLQSRVCCTVSIPFASLPAHAMMDVWICSSFVFLACVGFVDPSCIFGVLAYLFLFASSFPGIKLILDHVNFVTRLALQLTRRTRARTQRGAARWDQREGGRRIRG